MNKVPAVIAGTKVGLFPSFVNVLKVVTRAAPSAAFTTGSFGSSGIIIPIKGNKVAASLEEVRPTGSFSPHSFISNTIVVTKRSILIRKSLVVLGSSATI